MDRTSRDYQSRYRNMRSYNAPATSNFQSSLLSEISTDESQNFVLHLSEASSKEEMSSLQYYKDQAQKKIQVSKVIVISDSSESSSPEKMKRNYLFSYSDKNQRRSDNIMIQESSSSDESNSDNERIQFSDSNDARVSNDNQFKIVARVGASSEETICTNSDDKSSNHSLDKSHISATQDSPDRRVFNDDIFTKYSETRSKYFVDEPAVSCNITHRKYQTNHKNIRPKRPCFFTDMKKATESTDSRADTKGSGSSEEHEQVQLKKTAPLEESNLETDVTHITATPPEANKKNESSKDVTEVPPVTLSERKKKQIANWLLTNPADSRSASSCSNVSDGKKDDSSGNSSLERFELLYETPNNRGKIKQNKSVQHLLTDKSKAKGLQTTMDRFVKKTKTPKECRTPQQDKIMDPKTQSSKSSYVTGSENLGLLDCADVLDSLYGSEWRKNADVLFKCSEPRNKPVSKIDRAVQTEVKKNPKSKYQMVSVSDSESENGIISWKNKKAQTEIKRKPCKKLDSFIDDREPSDISGDSIYHTAITNQRYSTNSEKSKITSSIPKDVQRILSEICDPDTDNEEDAKKVIKAKPVNRKRLVFTDDDSDGSTSEFDPEDQVLPKPMPKKDFSKVPYYTPKSTSKTKSSNSEQRGVKSFLASLSLSVPMSETHPEAKIYKVNFKATKEELSRKLFCLYNEHIFDNKLPDDTPIEWSVRMTGTAGYCYNKRSIKSSGGITRSSRIQLATKIIDTPDRLRDTLVHEMCHAAAWLINDVSDGHGPYWKSWANKAMRVFPELPEIKRCHDYKINTKYTYRCTGCGYSIGRHSKSLDTEKKRCGHCYGKFEVLINKTMKSGTVQMKTPSRSKEPSGFALYVKENYNSIKQNRRSMKHGEVMKILGQQFSAIKIAKKYDNVEQNNVDSSDL